MEHTAYSPRPRAVLADGALWFVLISLASTTLLHYMTDIRLIPYHSIYRSLYYLPIAVAAVRFGWRGGVVTALTTSALYIPHVALSWQLMSSHNDAFNDLLENAVFLFVGALVGTLADRERAQRRHAQQAARQLAQANTQLHEQATQAEQTRAFVAAILESLDSGVLTLSAEERVMLVNDAAQRLLGAAYPLTVGARVPQLVRRYLDAGGRGYIQLTVGERILGLHGAALVGAGSALGGTVLVLDDLTPLRVLEEQVQRAQRLAALGRLAGGLAHEIRNPLGIVRAAVQLLGQRLGHDTHLAHYTEVIQSEVDRVDRLIEQLLAYARPLPVSRSPLDLDALITRTLLLMQPYATQQQVMLDAALPPTLPPISGDGALLQQALVNLLLNAIQATLAGGHVTVEGAVAGNGVRLIVRDTGRGIAADDLPHIFDPFWTGRADGTGLGLSIVQQIMQAHDGSVSVASNLGQGAVFTLELPQGAHNDP